MAASSNESFGLKIATALSIALTVVLLVAVYFLNSNLNLETEKNAKGQAENKKLNDSLREFTTQANEYRTLLGYPAIEEFEAAKTQIKKDQDQIKLELADIQKEIGNTVDEFKKKAEAKGIDASQFETLKQRAKEVVDLYTTNPDQSFKASLTRLKDLTVNQAKLTTNMALNYIDLRRDLELANQVNAEQKKVVEDAFAGAKAELDATIKKDEEARSGLVETTRKQAETIATADTNLENLKNEMTGKLEVAAKKNSQQKSQIRDMQNILSQKEDVMSKPGGRVTYVDYGSKTVRVSVNKSQGVRPLMRFSIFDKGSQSGLVSDKPKATVELVTVGDPQKGENDSLARIVKTFEANDPIRYNDYIYSVGWSYDHPQRFALVGKLDINRDGRDDRGEVIRMIEAAGGVIEFDLPPPIADRNPGIAAVARTSTRLNEPIPASTGRASGKITALAFAYVTDTRPSLVINARKAPDVTKEDSAFLEEESKAITEARDNSVRPLPLEKLLNLLGYDYAAPIEGRREAYDKNAIKRLTKPKNTQKDAETTTAPPSDTPATKDETPKEEMKDESPK